MTEKLKFAIIGGDLRFIFLCRNLLSDGHDVCVHALEKAELPQKVKTAGLSEAIENSDYIILGLPVSKDGASLNAPLSEEKIIINSSLKNKLERKTVFCGMADRLYKISRDFKKLSIIDYSQDEEFSVKNALLTAEGAIGIALNDYEGSIQGTRCLISGYGRIAKILALKLKLLGADVTITARKKEALLWADSLGYKNIDINKLDCLEGYGLVFNTVPSIIFDKDILQKTEKETCIIDLASMPGGVDFTAAEKLGLKTIHALGLPSKSAPKEAAAIIKSVIYSYIEGGGLCDI